MTGRTRRTRSAPRRVRPTLRTERPRRRTRATRSRQRPAGRCPGRRRGPARSPRRHSARGRAPRATPASPATSPDPRGPPVSAFRRSPRHPAGNADSSRDRSTGRRAPVAAATVAPPRQARRSGWSCRAFRSAATRPFWPVARRKGQTFGSGERSSRTCSHVRLSSAGTSVGVGWTTASSRSASAIGGKPGDAEGHRVRGRLGRGCRGYPGDRRERCRSPDDVCWRSSASRRLPTSTSLVRDRRRRSIRIDVGASAAWAGGGREPTVVCHSTSLDDALTSASGTPA